MKDNLSRVIVALDGKKATNVFFCLFTPHVGVNLDNLSFIAATFKSVVVNQLTNLFGVVRIFACNQDNRLDKRQSMFIAILSENSLAMFMKRETITDFHFLNIIGTVASHV